jgi:hypothetical protein
VLLKNGTRFFIFAVLIKNTDFQDDFGRAIVGGIQRETTV